MGAQESLTAGKGKSAQLSRSVGGSGNVATAARLVLRVAPCNPSRCLALSHILQSAICLHGTSRALFITKPYVRPSLTPSAHLCPCPTGAGLHTAASCWWDATTDGSRTVRWENKTMYCICTVFGLAV